MNISLSLKRLKNTIKKVIEACRKPIAFYTILDSGERYDPLIIGLDAAQLGRYEFAKQYINKVDTVLDIACGTGYGTNMISQICREATGVDLSKKAIYYAKKHYKLPNTKFYLSDFFKYKKRADIVVSFETIEHIQAIKFQEILEKLEQITKKKMIGSVPYGEKPKNNPHHVWFSIDEKHFDYLKQKGKITFFYQTSNGELTKKKKRNITYQNLVFVFQKKHYSHR